MICGVATDCLIPSFINPLIKNKEVSISGEPSSMPGKICE